jgi:hypothetical protein
MSILIALEAVPNRIQLLGRTISVEGPMSRGDLQAFIQQTDSNQFNNIVREAIRLDFLKEDNEHVLSLAVPEEVANVTEEFRSFCFDRLVTSVAENKDEDSSFARAVAWFLNRPIFPQLRWGEEFRQYIDKDLQGDDFFDLTNKERAQMFGYWAQFLGFMEWSVFDGATYCSADPTRAIEMIAKSTLKPGAAVALGTFLSELSNKAPVLEGGVIRKEIEGRSRGRRDGLELSQTTSLALLRLKLKGSLSLDMASDAEAWSICVASDTPISVSHLTLSASI